MNCETLRTLQLRQQTWSGQATNVQRHVLPMVHTLTLEDLPEMNEEERDEYELFVA